MYVAIYTARNLTWFQTRNPADYQILPIPRVHNSLGAVVQWILLGHFKKSSCTNVLFVSLVFVGSVFYREA